MSGSAISQWNGSYLVSDGWLHEGECAASFGQTTLKLLKVQIKKEFEKCPRFVDAEQTQAALSEKKIKWKFLVERAPCMVG